MLNIFFTRLHECIYFYCYFCFSIVVSTRKSYKFIKIFYPLFYRQTFYLSIPLFFFFSFNRWRTILKLSCIFVIYYIMFNSIWVHAVVNRPCSCSTYRSIFTQSTSIGFLILIFLLPHKIDFWNLKHRLSLSLSFSQ